MGISTSRLCDRRAYRGRIDGEYRMRASSVASRSRTRGWRTATGPMPVMISRSGRWPWRTTRCWPVSVLRSACFARNSATSASTAWVSSARAPLRRISVRESVKAPGWVSLITLLSDTAYHSFIGEVEALNTTTIRRLTLSRRHQLLAIALGGVPSLGYQAQDRKLVIVDSEAKIVRLIFRRHAELGSVRWLRDELEALSIQSKLRTSPWGRSSGGKPFARGALYPMLQNRIYRGEIVHNQQSYPGEHEPIIDQPLWDAVQAKLAGNAAQHNDGGKTRQPSLLAGMLFDGDGNRMTPSHAVKKRTRYRYYVSRSLITKDRTDDSAGLRIPAAEIEQLVSDREHRWLLDPGSIYKSTAARLTDPSIQHRRVARAAEIGNHWPELPVARKRAILPPLIERIDVRVERIDIRLRPPRPAALVDGPDTSPQDTNDEE